MKNIFLSTALLLLFGATACKNNKAADQQAKQKEILDKISESGNINVGSQNYKVDVPAGWTTKDTTMNNVKFHFLMAPKPDGDFNANINILNESMQGFSFDDYKKKTIETMKNYDPNLNIVENGDMDAGNLKGSWFHYNMVQNGIKMDIINYTFPKDGIAYIITASAKQGEMDKYRSLFDGVAKSFQVN